MVVVQLEIHELQTLAKNSVKGSGFVFKLMRQPLYRNIAVTSGLITSMRRQTGFCFGRIFKLDNVVAFIE